ncbi:hypothetical protein Mapa_010715 [Marchantia paleacea]|nr:hypothetical protein Mapa_010715 [Marchantia paleacea]
MAPDVNNSTADSGVLTIVNNGNQIQTQPLCMSANLHPVDQGGGLDGGGGGARNGRDYKRTNWTVGECLVLQAAKREDYERQSNGGPKEKHKTAAERWQAVEDFCWTHNVQRSGQQCKDRWEKMSADFKKIYDYERHVLNGHMHYWQMTLEEKKVKRLPNTFFQEVYNGLSQWFTRGRGADTGNGNQENLGSLLREPEASAKAGSIGRFSGSDEAESEEPAAEPLLESGSGKRRSNDGDLLSGEREGISNGREYRRTNWTLPESLVLQAAKREDLERQYNSGPKEKHMSATERWQAVEEYCWSRGVYRSGQQCRDRWDKLSADFKKISDYEKQNVIGQKSYWLMTPEEKKAKRLPSTFWEKLFSSMSEWFGKSRNIDLRVVIHDSSQPPRQDGDEGFFGTDEDEDGSDPESAPVLDSSVDKERKGDGEVLVSARDGKPGRDYKKTNWTLEECMVLQAAKQDDFERQAKEKNRKAADRWQAVEDFCFRQNVCRSGQQCKDRWEKMSVDFKKIHNYQRHTTDDTANYWTLTGEEKKSKRLPLTFWQDVFVAMSKWFTKDRIGGSENIAHDSEAQHQEDSGRAGSNKDLSGSDEGDSDPGSDPFVDSRSRKRRKASVKINESLAEIMERSNLATQKILLECEDRKDRRLERTLEANVRRLERTLEANERIAISYCQAFVSLADAIRSVAATNPQG